MSARRPPRRPCAADGVDSAANASRISNDGHRAIARARRRLEIGLDGLRERRAVSREHERRDAEGRRVDPRDPECVIVHGEQASADFQQRGARGHTEQRVLHDHARLERSVLDRRDPHGAAGCLLARH